MKPQHYEFRKSPAAELSVSARGTSLTVRGRAEGKFWTECSRCAEPVELKADEAISRLLKLRKDDDYDQEESEGISFYSGETVDLADLVEEELILALPFTAYCSADCKGICPGCGVNLNDAECECSEEEAEESAGGGLAALKDLKIQ